VKKFYWIIIVLILLTSCATDKIAYKPGTAAETVVSPNFQYVQGIKVAVLPFNVTGNPEKKLDYNLSDKLSIKLMKMGFIVVERTQLEFIFTEHNLKLTGMISAQDMKLIGELLGIKYIVFGTLNEEYESAKASGGAYTNIFTGKTQYTPLRYSGGHYYSYSESLRFVDINTGEIVISSQTGIVKGSMVEEMAESIRLMLFGNTEY